MSLAAIGPKPFDTSLKKVIQPGGWRECLGPNGTTFEQFVSRGASIDRSATIMLVDLNKQPLSEEQLAAEAAAQVERAVAGGAQGAGALPLGPLSTEEHRGSVATVSTVELSLEDGARSY